MGISGLGYHIQRLRHEFGQKLSLGEREYRVRGYIPNRLTTHSRHEKHLMAPLRRAMAARSGLVIDVGVNTGQTLLKLIEIDPNLSYLGFEPQIDCCLFIDQFLRDNALSNARVICLALSDMDGMLPIYVQGACDEMASLVERSVARGDRDMPIRFIPVRSGDDVLREMAVEKVGLIKVDVEGAEISVFRGLEATIKANRPVCFFEVLPNFTGLTERVAIDATDAALNRKSAAEIATFFHGLDYELRQIDVAGEEHVIEAFELDDMITFVSSDYIAYPRH